MASICTAWEGGQDTNSPLGHKLKPSAAPEKKKEQRDSQTVPACTLCL